MPKKHIVLSFFTVLLCAVQLQAQTLPAPTQQKNYSVLSPGQTLKVSVKQNGIYRITYEDLVRQGLINAPVSVEKMAVYGNVSGVLPYFNTPDIYDDLTALPISIEDKNNDGLFGQGDCLLFYGESPHRWIYRPASGQEPIFDYKPTPYGDATYYFVGTHAEYVSAPQAQTDEGAATVTVTAFPERTVYESDLYNLCEGGLDWVGERFSENNASQRITLSCPGAQNSEALLLINTAAQIHSGSASFTVQTGESGGNRTLRISHTPAPSGAQDLYCSDLRQNIFPLPLSGTLLNLNFTYTKSSASDAGYLDRVILFYTRALNFSGGSMNFRAPEAVGADTRFEITSSRNLRVWDVSDIYRIREVELTRQNNLFRFQTKADNTLHEYIAFEPAACPAPAYSGLVQSQNLHEQKNIDYVIVYHPNFEKQAKKLEKLHQERNGYRTLAVSTTKVYNEFSSGAKDPSAIRLLMRKLKMRSDEGSAPRFLCLMGAASYDYRNIRGSVSDFVPTFESSGNASEGAGTPLEDNFAYLDDDEGIAPDKPAVGEMDIAVGRLPVRSTADAEQMLEKIDIYSSPVKLKEVEVGSGNSNFGDWKSEVAVVTDDSFEGSMESMVLHHDQYDNLYPEYHLSKLYSDAYPRNISSVSTRILDLENAIKNRFKNGSLFIGYLGHSGWDAWSDEKIFTNAIIDNLYTTYAFPICVASSCSFAIFDKAGQLCGAERLVLKEHGGGIAIMGTTRTAQTSSIEDIFSRFLYALCRKTDGERPTIGSAYLTAKNNNTGRNGEKFVLLGDPGLQVPLPEYNVTTLTVNGKRVDSETPDTLKALSMITIEGCITDHNGNILNDFNGEIISKIFDKPLTLKTLGLYNSRLGQYNAQIPYSLQNSLIFQGKTLVTDGHFSFSFIVPKDIQYEYGFGKILYYAYSDRAEANGAFSKLVVGGFNDDMVMDDSEPIIKLYLDGPSSRGLTVGVQPTLYAKISDKYGLNTTGSGIGHDMVLIIDGDEDNPIVVNNLFHYETGSYTSGSLSYFLNDLEAGSHTVKLKVWNINNISATATLAFTVNDDKDIEIFDLIVAPNPTSGDYVDFYFTHNGEAGCAEKCQIQVFTLQGGLVSTLNYNVSGGNGHSVGPLRWNMREKGLPLKSGIYICRVMITSKDGNRTGNTVKLVVM